MKRHFFAFSFLSLIISAAARQPTSSALSPSTFADTEVSTNVSFAAWEEHQKRFEYRLSFDATSSDKVKNEE